MAGKGHCELTRSTPVRGGGGGGGGGECLVKCCIVNWRVVTHDSPSCFTISAPFIQLQHC